MSNQVATSLFQNNIMGHCLAILNRLMELWQAREKTGDSEENIATLLKPQPGHSPPDMSPFFLKQYVKVLFFGKSLTLYSTARLIVRRKLDLN